MTSTTTSKRPRRAPEYPPLVLDILKALGL